MSKSNDQSNSLDNIKFVQDITPQTAANYSGGAARINDGNNDPDVILYEDAGSQGQLIGINASIGDGIANLQGFNDKTSSVQVRKGKWQLFRDANFGGDSSGILEAGQVYEPSPDANDTLTSIKRIG